MRASYTSAICLAALSLVAPSTRAADGGAGAPGRDPLVTISIVGTNDLHGHIEALPRIGGYIANLRRARARDGGGVVLLDAGDMFQGTLESNMNEGAAVVRAYNVLKYDAAAIGNHEFDFGPAGPAHRAAGARRRSAWRAQGTRRRGAVPVPGRQPGRRGHRRAAGLAQCHAHDDDRGRRRQGRHHRPRQRGHRVHDPAGELRRPARPSPRAHRGRGGQGPAAAGRHGRHRRRARGRLVHALRPHPTISRRARPAAKSFSSRARCPPAPSTRSSRATRTPGSPTASRASRSSRRTTRATASDASTSTVDPARSKVLPAVVAARIFRAPGGAEAGASVRRLVRRRAARARRRGRRRDRARAGRRARPARGAAGRHAHASDRALRTMRNPRSATCSRISCGRRARRPMSR